MYSDFIEEYNGFLALTDEEYERAKQTDPNFPRVARQKYLLGKGYEGYWTTRHLMKNLKDAVRIAQFKYPR